MAKKIAVDCGDNTSLEQLFKLAIRNVECGEALTCDNHNLSWQQLLRQCFVVDEDTGEVSLNVCGCEGGGGGIVAVTYDELVELIDGGELVAGSWYLLTDFRTVHYFTDGTTTLEDINTGELEPLLLLATSASTVDSRVFSPSHPTDVIHYAWDAANWLNDMSFSADQATIVPGWKGIITYRWDTKQDNSTGYDFRNVKFRRWAIDEAGSEFDDLYYSWNSTDCNGLGVDSVDYQDVYTFNGDYDNYTMNHISKITMSALVDGLSFVIFNTILNNIVFYSPESFLMVPVVSGNSFNTNCVLMTFTAAGIMTNGFVAGNSFKNANSRMVFANLAFSTFGSFNYSNTFSGDVNGSTFGNANYSNTFSGDVNGSTFGNANYSNTFSGDVNGSTFGNSNHSNTFNENIWQINLRNEITGFTFGYIQELEIPDGITGCDVSAVNLNTDYSKTIGKAGTGELFYKYDAWDTDHFETIYVVLCGD
jgi:hypothetical protein